MTDAEMPRVQAVLMQLDNASKRNDANLWIVSSCPFCGKHHSHAGGSSETDPRARLGPHPAPCKQGTYVLVDIADSGR